MFLPVLDDTHAVHVRLAATDPMVVHAEGRHRPPGVDRHAYLGVR